MSGAVHITFDQDWAPAWATEALVTRVRRAGVRSTLFVTHGCPSLPLLRSLGGVELGLHPNFLPGSSHGRTEEEVLAHLAQIVPDARGVRAHCLVRSTPLLLRYGRLGLRYEASDLMFGLAGLRPLVSWNGVVHLPIFWEDDVHLEHGLPCRLGAVDAGAPGLRVFNFHPVLVALNAANLGSYARLKAALSVHGRPLWEATPDDLTPFRQDATPGVSDLLSELLDHLDSHPEQVGGTLSEVADHPEVTR